MRVLLKVSHPESDTSPFGEARGSERTPVLFLEVDGLMSVDRFAVFVDAGYLYAEGGKLCCNTPDRKWIRLDSSGASKFLASTAEESCGMSPLRTYWYDGARHGIPTMEQQLIAALPNVKLRLGRLNVKNQQKGVDALIYRDLMTLARERAIGEAYVLSGDEDLREGVRTAQDLGVRVTLIGIVPRDANRNQSKELVNEADDTIRLTKRDLTAFILKRQTPAMPSFTHVDPMTEVSAAAAKYTQRWLDQATDEELEPLRAGRPRIPVLLDASLLSSVENEIDVSLREHEELRRAARRAFWKRIGGTSPDR